MIDEKLQRLLQSREKTTRNTLDSPSPPKTYNPLTKGTMCQSPSRVLRTAASGRLTRSTSSFSESRQSAPERYGYKRGAGSISRQEAIKQAAREQSPRRAEVTFNNQQHKAAAKIVHTSDINTPRFSERSRTNQEELYSKGMQLIKAQRQLKEIRKASTQSKMRGKKVEPPKVYAKPAQGRPQSAMSKLPRTMVRPGSTSSIKIDLRR